jgi:uncharacterized integral membrane protein
MRNMGDSDDLSGGSDAKSEGFRPSGRQIGGAIIGVLMIVFIAANNKTVLVSLVFVSVELPLWLVLAVTALLGLGVGMLLGSRRAKAKFKNR